MNSAEPIEDVSAAGVGEDGGRAGDLPIRPVGAAAERRRSGIRVDAAVGVERMHRLEGIGHGELGRDLVPEILRGAVEAERPHAGAAQIVTVDQVILLGERGGVVVIQLAPAVVVAAAGVTAPGTPPRCPRRLRGAVPSLGWLLVVDHLYP